MEKWQGALILLAVVMAVCAVIHMVWKSVAQRRRSARLIAAARVRSGHIPGELPTVRGGLTGHTGFGEPGLDSTPALATNDEPRYAVIDEQPRIRIRYVDPLGARKLEATLQVQHLDVHKRMIVGCDLPADVRHIPLRNILAARIAESGQRFNIDTWVDAVRVARRRRGMMA